MNSDDIPHLKKLHDKHYSQDFYFPDFMKNFLSAFIIESNTGEIIIGGGVQATAETMIVTDPNQSNIQIGRALIHAQGASVYTCQKYGIERVHAFTNNGHYQKHLIQHGFYRRSQALALKVYNGRG